MDGNTTTYCETQIEAYPFLVFTYEHKWSIDMVRIINRADDHGDRTQNLHVIVTNTYPTTGAIVTGT